MLACSNAECSRRFCEVSLSSSVVVLPHTHPRSLARVCLRVHFHLKIFFFFERMQKFLQDAFVSHTLACACTLQHCLLTHLSEDVDPCSSAAWVVAPGGKKLWQCPICRKKCCCSVTTCSTNHRHCKAYRYRRRYARVRVRELVHVRVLVLVCMPVFLERTYSGVALFVHRMGGWEGHVATKSPPPLPLHMTYCCPATHPYACRLKDDDDAFYLRHN